MNIVILPSWFRLKSNITHGSFFLEQAVAMANAGHRVTLIDAQIIPTRTYLKSERDIGIKHYTEKGVEIYEYKTGGYCTGRSAPLTVKLYTIKVERLLKKLLKTHQVDILHAHSFYPAGIAAVRLGKKYGIPVVLTEHSSSLINDWLHLNGVYDYVKPTYDSAAASVCVSDFFAEHIYKKYALRKKPVMIGNVLNPLFQYAPPPKNKVFTFIMVARLYEKKRVNHIISAVSELKSQGINVSVNVAGDGPERQSLEAQAKALGVQDNIHFHGNLSRQQIYELLQCSDALVHASVIETFGVVYIEAMATGRPVVTVKNGGADELINEKNGIITSPDDAHALAEAMKQMIKNYDRYDCRAISDNTINTFSEAAVAKAYEDLYLEAIRKLRSGRDA